MRIMPIKTSVASQTIAVTVKTSAKLTTPTAMERTAPMTAVVPI